MPLELLATIPPMVQAERLAGSRPISVPWRARAALRTEPIVPGFYLGPVVLDGQATPVALDLAQNAVGLGLARPP